MGKDESRSVLENLPKLVRGLRSGCTRFAHLECALKEVCLDFIERIGDGLSQLRDRHRRLLPRVAAHDDRLIRLRVTGTYFDAKRDAPHFPLAVFPAGG